MHGKNEWREILALIYLQKFSRMLVPHVEQLRHFVKLTLSNREGLTALISHGNLISWIHVNYSRCLWMLESLSKEREVRILLYHIPIWQFEWSSQNSEQSFWKRIEDLPLLHHNPIVMRWWTFSTWKQLSVKNTRVDRTSFLCLIIKGKVYW